MTPRERFAAIAGAVSAIAGGAGAVVTHHGVNAWGLAGVAVGVLVGGVIVAVKCRRTGRPRI